MSMFSRLVDWHKGAIEKVKAMSGLSDYQLLWAAAGKGVIIGYILGVCL
tara:strand:+ start:160 stop:306 length:147 start_codon:yes stop_codon:yes gene_type:complete